MATNNAINNRLPTGLTGDNTLTSNGVLYGAGTSPIGVTAAASSAGQVLTSTAGAPVFSKAGNMVLIQTQTASSSTALNFTTGITSTYNTYLIVFSNVVPATSTDFLKFLVSTNGGSSYLATGYLSGENVYSFNSATGTNANGTTSVFMSGSLSTTAGFGTSGIIWCYDLTNGSQPMFSGQSAYRSSTGGTLTLANLVATNTSTTINALQFVMSTGNISTGTISIYGILE